MAKICKKCKKKSQGGFTCSVYGCGCFTCDECKYKKISPKTDKEKMAEKQEHKIQN